MAVLPFRRANRRAAAAEPLAAAHLSLLSCAVRHRDCPDRNYLACTPGTAHGRLAAEMERGGILECAAGPLWSGQFVYRLTESGYRLLRQLSHALRD